MKNWMIVLAVAGVSQVAQADGFVCTSNDGSLNVKAFNHTQAMDGTRNAAVMIISDNNVQAGRKTIAKFESFTELLSNSGANYSGSVDLRFNNTGRKGELIGSTKLGQLDTVTLDVNFSYGHPVRKGDILSADLILAKRNGDQEVIAMTCARHLKN